MPGPASERATLSRDLADFLIELSIALHKHAMYPEGHPSLAPAAACVTRVAGLLLEDRAPLSLGVARQQLVIEGVATDPKHPVLAERAARLHRHHLGAVTFRRGVEAGEMARVLKTLAVDAERSGQPLGLGPPERLRAWACVQLHPLTYERLELVDDGAPASERGARGAQLWVGLARAALAAQAGDDRPTPTEPAVIARAIDDHPRTDAAAYDQVIVGYLLQIADELKTAGSAEGVALRRRTSRLIGALKPETLRRLVEMGGDFVQRRNFVYDATDGMAVDAVLDIVRAAADSSHQTITRSPPRIAWYGRGGSASCSMRWPRSPSRRARRPRCGRASRRRTSCGNSPPGNRWISRRSSGSCPAWGSRPRPPCWTRSPRPRRAVSAAACWPSSPEWGRRSLQWSSGGSRTRAGTSPATCSRCWRTCRRFRRGSPPPRICATRTPACAGKPSRSRSSFPSSVTRRWRSVCRIRIRARCGWHWGWRWRCRAVPTGRCPPWRDAPWIAPCRPMSGPWPSAPSVVLGRRRRSRSCCG